MEQKRNLKIIIGTYYFPRVLYKDIHFMTVNPLPFRRYYEMLFPDSLRYKVN